MRYSTTMSIYVEKNAAQVNSLWDFYQDELGSKVFEKGSKVIMRIAARIVARRTETTEEQFLGDFVTTVGRRIYVPFTLGVEKDDWSWRDQMLLCVHEHQHVVQWRRQPVRFLTQYARDTRKRALFEAEAFLSEFEACAAFDWNPPNLEQRIGTLKGYGLLPEDIEAARLYLYQHIGVQGSVGPQAGWTRSGRLAAAWASGGPV